MAKKQTECNSDTINQDKHKKVMFNEDITTYIYMMKKTKKKQIRQIKNQKKKDVMFEFLPANTDNCGSLFSINTKRKIVNRETAFMAKKQTRCNNNVIIKISARRLCSMKM